MKHYVFEKASERTMKDEACYVSISTVLKCWIVVQYENIRKEKEIHKGIIDTNH